MGNGGDDKKINSPETEDKYLDKSSEMFSRDLLQSFLGSTSEYESMKEAEQEEIKLNLGLSLGGGFGVEPKNLLRSASTAGLLPMERDVSDTSPSAVAAKSSLARTSSMPIETEDEKRKRKESQSLRRMEAKRRRSEKRRTVQGDKEMELYWMGDLEREKHLSMMKKLDIPVGGPVLEASSNLGGGIDVAMAKRKGVSAWGSGGMQGFGQAGSRGSSMESTGKSSSSLMGDLEREKHLPVMKKSDLSVGGTVFEASSNHGGGIDLSMAKGKGVSGRFGQAVSQGSIVESTGGSSSSLSNLESKALQGSSRELSLASTLSLRERSQLDVGSSKTEEKENPGSMIQSSAKPPVDTSRTGGRDTRTSAVEDMPSVYTRGDGPNGRRVDGILYRYGRGEEVRIMCICHGIFHSPAEFVLHAGGMNVDNPLRHIVINPNSSPLL